MTGAFSMQKALRFASLALAVAVSAAAAGCGGGGEGGSISNDLVARVGDEGITRVEFDKLIAQAERGYKTQKRPFPSAGSQEYKQLQSQALTFLVQRSEYAQKAEELGIEVSDDQVDNRLVQIKKQYFGGDEKKYRAQLVQQGLTDAQVRGDLRSQLISDAIFKKVTGDVKVTDTEIRDYYSRNPAQYSTPQTREVRHILVKTKALADKIHADLEKGADFAQLAKKYSQDPGSKSLGGKLTISRGQTVPEFDKAAFALKTGAISQPVKTQFGWHVIEAVKPAKPRQSTPLAQVRDSIRQQLLQQKQSDTMTKWVKDVTGEFCDGKLKFQTGFQPQPDPCADQGATATTPGGQ
jgi:parvulin-like peptidyl-prolyl isomerase